jgi:ferredoxin
MVKHPRIVVDMTRCEGSGMCALLFPDLIDLDRYGFPVVLDVDLKRDGDVRRARRAARACPHGALSLLEPEPGAADR